MAQGRAEKADGAGGKGSDRCGNGGCGEIFDLAREQRSATLEEGTEVIACSGDETGRLDAVAIVFIEGSRRQNRAVARIGIVLG